MNESTSRARTLRRNSTDAEFALWRLLRSSSLAGTKFRRQQPIGPYIADFVSFSHRLIVECDGGQHAGNAYDQARDAWFANQRFRTLRFWNHDILANRDGVLQAILLHLTPSPSRSAGPSLSRKGRGEAVQSPSPLAGEGRGEG